MWEESNFLNTERIRGKSQGKRKAVATAGAAPAAAESSLSTYVYFPKTPISHFLSYYKKIKKIREASKEEER